MTLGRKPIGKTTMTVAERKRRQRATARELGVPTRDQIIAAFGRAMIDKAPEISSTLIYERISEQADSYLSNLGFKRRPIQAALKQLKEGGGTE